MNRRESLAALLGIAVIPRALRAAGDRMPRIGYLALESIRDTPSRERQAFLDGLGDFGLVVGKSVEIVYRSAENEADFLPAMCEELLREKVDVLATVGEQPTLACLKTTRTAPIVFLAAGDPIGFGASESLARPTRNATGVTYILRELAGKRIEFLRLAVPAAERVAFLWDRGKPESQIEARVAQAAAGRLGIQAIPMPIETQADLNARFRQIADERQDAIYVSFAAGVIARNRTAIVETALRHRLPVISGWRFMTEAGGLLSYSPDIQSMFRRSAYYVNRILEGAQPRELPIEQATTIELMINLRTARRLGLTMPSDLLLRADRVIE